MSTYIQDLNISPTVKSALHGIGFTTLSELEGHNYITLAKKFPQNYNLEPIINALNPLGYLLPPENEVSIYEITISRRLQHIFQRNNIMYLSQLSSYPKEDILRFRNMGEKTVEELEDICKKYDIHIRSLQSMKEVMSQYKLPAKIYPMLFDKNISCIEDFRQKNVDDLYNICGKDFSMTMKIYYILKNNEVELQKGQDTFIFEILSEKRATLVWSRLGIITISQLHNFDQQGLSKMLSTTPSLASAVKTILQII